MKKVIFVTACLALAAGAFGVEQVIIIGTQVSGNAIPWWGSSYNSMRFQCLWLQSDIGYAGAIRKIEWERSSTAGSGFGFNETRVLLCHTTKTALEATFNNNYTGFTPVTVLPSTTVTIPTGTGWWETPITNQNFMYNNTNNLLMEVLWNTDTGGTHYMWRSGEASRRVYATDHNASSGSVQANAQRIRLTIETGSGLAPTSLGRVKSLYH